MASDTPPILSLAARLDTDAATPLRDALLSKRGAALHVDATEVSRMGALCASVLAAAARSWTTDGHALTIINPSDGFNDACERLGVKLADFNTGAAA